MDFCKKLFFNLFILSDPAKKKVPDVLTSAYRLKKDYKKPQTYRISKITPCQNILINLIKEI